MTLRVDKQAVARAFGRAASHYDAHAVLQRLAAMRCWHAHRLTAGCSCWMPGVAPAGTAGCGANAANR